MKDRDFNIFDEAAKQAGKKKVKPATPPPPPEPKEAVAPPTDEETQSMLKRIHDMEQDLDDKMEKISELSGMSRKEISRFIENPKNFPLKQWEEAQKQKDDLEKKLLQEFGVTIKKRALRKKKKKLAKGRRGKTLGARKGWIQM